MPKGFFHESVMVQSRQPNTLIPKCGACGLLKHCLTPKMEPTGKGKRKILIVAEAPGRNEDQQGVQLVGNSGEKLMEVLRKFGVDMRRDCRLTNSVICRPRDVNDPKDPNITPTDNQIDYCRPNLIRTIREFEPEIIIPIGGPAVKSLLGWLWKDDVGSISRWVGWQIPNQKLNAWICPTFHPSFLLHEKSSVADLLFEKHIAAAVAKKGRPYDVVPKYEDEVIRIRSSTKAARIIREMARRGGLTAFDYETNMLKPEDSRARIISCSVCWRGKHTIAFMWHGEAVEAMGELVRSRCAMVASNLKFEERWTRRAFGFGVKHWKWDTMLGAHAIDNRSGITSIKFQSFVLLGAESYDDHIKPLLKANGDDRVNQILKEINQEDLLLYNGLDSLLEYHVAIKQMKKVGYE